MPARTDVLHGLPEPVPRNVVGRDVDPDVQLVEVADHIVDGPGTGESPGVPVDVDDRELRPRRCGLLGHEHGRRVVIRDRWWRELGRHAGLRANLGHPRWAPLTRLDLNGSPHLGVASDRAHGEDQRENREEAGVTHGVNSLFRGVERNRRKPYPRTGACDPGGDDTPPFGLGFERPEDASRAVDAVSRRPIPSGKRGTRSSCPGAVSLSWRSRDGARRSRASSAECRGPHAAYRRADQPSRLRQPRSRRACSSWRRTTRSSWRPWGWTGRWSCRLRVLCGPDMAARRLPNTQTSSPPEVP